MQAPELKDAYFSREQLQKLLEAALAQGAEYAEVYIESSRRTAFDLDAGAIKSATEAESLGVGVRAVVGNQVGYAHSADVSEAALLEVARAAALIASAGSPSTRALEIRPFTAPARYRAELEPSRVEAPAKAEVLRRADRAARAYDSRVATVLGAFIDVEQRVRIVTTDGRLVDDERTMGRLSVTAIAQDGSERRVGSWGGGGRAGLEQFGLRRPDEGTSRPEDIAREAARMAVAQLGARPAPAGEQTVILSPGSSGVLLHEAVGHGLEADFIRKGTSLFCDRVGQRVASELCTVVDDGTLFNLRGSLNVDDEGNPTGRTVLIENGILRGYLTDRLNAGLMKLPVTGNGRREGYQHAPLPRMTNTFLLAGKDDPAEMLRSVKKGLYCAAFGGGQVDISNGNFVFEVREGYLIEDGRITAPVKGATLIGVGPQVLEKITAVGADAKMDPGMYTCGKAGQSVPVGVGMPSVRIDGVTVGGTAV
ncbi:MAG: TldD/PmbA family protein [Deltaproteobacteria bacterium]|nr:TldD/PmbA family protein [Deltaproteobacteria bacterium]